MLDFLPRPFVLRLRYSSSFCNPTFESPDVKRRSGEGTAPSCCKFAADADSIRGSLVSILASLFQGRPFFIGFPFYVSDTPCFLCVGRNYRPYLAKVDFVELQRLARIYKKPLSFFQFF